ncbi:MAG: MAPEG family protein [Gammaproteobacteria bacterium]|nr:MAPEG family protein [Gammaproteobacteria bacterium]
MGLTKWLYLAILAQIAIPMWVLLLNAKRKSAEYKAGNVSEDAPTDNAAWSLPVLLTSNSLANQFQLPILFYVLCFIFIQMQQVSLLLVVLSWWFVVTRWIHALVHVNTNYIPHRFVSFLLGVLALVVMFFYAVWLVLQL